MVTKRRAEAVWRADHGLWEIGVQKKGVRRHFSSPIKGRKGKHQAESLADDWLTKGTEDMRAIEAWDEFIAYTKENKSQSVYVQTEGLGRRYIRPIFARRSLADITPAIWQTAINKAAKAGLSRRSCINVRSAITAFLKYCRLNRYNYDPVIEGDLTIPSTAAPEKEKKALTDNEIQTVFTTDTITITHPHGPKYGTKQKYVHYIHAYRFYIVTGLRRGELAGLKNSDISGDTMTISRNINRFNEITHGKNDNARRNFKLTPTMKRVLEDQKAYLKSARISSQWVFPDRFGERPDPNAIYENWRTYRKKTGISQSLHELRHTFISLTKSDLPMELLKSQVGHSAATNTSRLYAHEVDGDRERTARIIEKVITLHLRKKYKKPKTHAKMTYKKRPNAADVKNIHLKCRINAE